MPILYDPCFQDSFIIPNLLTQVPIICGSDAQINDDKVGSHLWTFRLHLARRKKYRSQHGPPSLIQPRPFDVLETRNMFGRLPPKQLQLHAHARRRQLWESAFAFKNHPPEENHREELTNELNVGTDVVGRSGIRNSK